MPSSTRVLVIEALARRDLATPRTAARAHHAGELATLASDVAGAVERDELVLHYQPILDLRTGKCRRVEALIRWQHPRYGLVLPGELLPLARRAGVLGKLGRWVLNEAIGQAAAWRAGGLGLSIGINFSTVELTSPATVQGLINAIRSNGPESISLEVDAAAVAAGEVPQASLDTLLAAGARIALDDVLLDAMPAAAVARRFDELKLSRALVRRATVDEASAGELSGLVRLAHDLHLDVVAVGVEDSPTRDLLAALGCDYAQGYWVSRPLLPDRIAPVRRWFAGVAFTGAMALAAEVGSAAISAPTLAATCSPVDASRSLFSALCSVNPGSAGSQAAPQDLDTLRERTGVVFVVEPSAASAVIVDARIDPPTRGALAAAVDRDIAQLEHDYGHRFLSAPTVYVFATRSSFAVGLQRIFGARAPDAAVLAAASGGVALPRQNAIVVNLQNTDPAQVTIVRHELTHILVHQIAGPGATIPAWFDEGLATLEQDSLVNTDGGARARAITSGLLRTGRIGLSALRDPETWEERNFALDGQAYLVAAEAARLLEGRSFRAGIVNILAATGRGIAFADAFAQETGESVLTFENSFEERLTAEESPRITVAPSAGGVTWTLSGFGPESVVDIKISGSSYLVEYRVTMDGYGTYRAAFGSTVAPGQFTIDASGHEGAAHSFIDLTPAG